ncbi:nicotinate-nucleotide adenylyltransferase [Massilia horti]|uniref:nicotinate-nucleotide adenylyltransferase n=1 Tax=Massilia horti TaxID=2562153 RepID=UPI001E561FEB|nr:nicotinate-nucleotide adenylyltransferase [Massilia horti]
MTRCIALLGGSFDPVHHGHVALATLFAGLLQPDELRIIPAGKPWYKSGLRASDADRVAMLERAFKDAKLSVVLDMQEIERAAPTYTVDTLKNVRAEVGPDASVVFIMGADQLRMLDTWREWRTLFELANIAVAARPGFALDHETLPPAVADELRRRLATPSEVRATAAGRVCVVQTLAVDISATQVREAIRTGTDTNALIAPQVLDYIQQHNLYKS